MIKTFDEFMEMLDDLVRVVCSVLMAVMTVTILIQVFARYIPAIKPPSWTEEFARYVMIWLATIAASHGIRHWNNVGVDFVLNRIKGTAHRIVSLLIKFTVLTCFIIVTYLCCKVFPIVGMRQISATLRVPIFYAHLGIIIGFILCDVQLVDCILCEIAGIKVSGEE